MKFAKTYIETLASSHFPEEWKRGAVDYKQLKKLINGVVAELESLGLGADVLKDLLVPPAEEVSSTAAQHSSSPSDNIHDDNTSQLSRQWVDTLPSGASPHSTPRPPDGFQDEQAAAAAASSSSSKLNPPAQDAGGSAPLSSKRRKSATTNTTATAKTPADLMRTHDVLMRRAASASSTTSSSGGSHHSASTGAGSHGSGSGSDWAAKPGKTFHNSAPTHHDEHGRSHMDSEGRRWLNGKDGRRARAEYELGGTQDHPIPRIRLFIESPVGSDDEFDSESTDADTDSQSETHHDDDHIDDVDDHDEGSDFASSLRDSNGKIKSDGLPASSSRSTTSSINTARPRSSSQLTNDSPVTLRGRVPASSGPGTASASPANSLIARTPVITTAGVAADQEALAGFKMEALPEAALTEDEHARRAARRARRRHHSPSSGRRFRRREIVIPLTADTEFLESLTGALSNLSKVQERQREHFVAATEDLASSIARVASPYATNNDMYVWREIFALWVDSQIFESSREKDRGELSVEESEARLKRFAEELAKRGWIAKGAQLSEDAADVAAVEAEQGGARAGKGKKGKRGGGGGGGASLFRLRHPHRDSNQASSSGEAETISLPDGTVVHVSHDPRTQSALDEFLKLNVELLDVKKFQAVNIEAARKILKKHDKRTALTATADLREFMAMQEHQREEQLAALKRSMGGPLFVSSDPHSEGWVGAADRLNLMEVNGGIAPVPLKDGESASVMPVAKLNSLSIESDKEKEGTVGTIGAGALTTTNTHPSLAALLPTSATGLMGGSLPHILLSLLTTTLLPILPSIDESSCVICTSVAWRPVRLSCGHLFCIRCLVKLQRQRRDDCPLCRAPLAVKNANGSNLDEAMGNLLKAYFPEEVKAKQKENDREVNAEEQKEMGLENTHCIIC
ncbi:hypothetical protein OC845_005374 [Tilletia horrida]|nr:hypothetical protein OC845_005374 [Tilletia horrida]